MRAGALGIGLAFILLMSMEGCKRSEAAPLKGREIFGATCARCHGAEGTGGLPLWDGGPSPQNFHDRAFQRSRTDDQIKQTIKNGKGSGMPAFGPALTDEQITELVVHIRTFDGEKR